MDAHRPCRVRPFARCFGEILGGKMEVNGVKRIHTPAGMFRQTCWGRARNLHQ